MASAIVRTFVGNLKPSLATSSRSRIVVATPAGQRHEFGALIVAAFAAMENWDVTYLGPDIPADDIAAAARVLKAATVALSIVYPASDGATREELYRLRASAPEKVLIIAGGRAASSYRLALQEIRALVIHDMTELRRELQARSQARS
jgi:methanogenic corrinoid protein MtbC1